MIMDNIFIFSDFFLYKVDIGFIAVSELMIQLLQFMIELRNLMWLLVGGLH